MTYGYYLPQVAVLVPVVTVVIDDNDCNVDITSSQVDAPTVAGRIPPVTESLPSRIPLIRIALRRPSITPLTVPVAIIPIVVVPIVIPVIIPISVPIRGVVIPVVILRCVDIIVVRHTYAPLTRLYLCPRPNILLLCGYTLDRLVRLFTLQM